MKHPKYDSPFTLVMSNITTQTAKNIDEMCWQAVQQVGIDIDKEKLIVALKQDAERYHEAYVNGYNTGYEKRDDDIVRCKDCKYGFMMENGEVKCGNLCTNDGYSIVLYRNADWYCADGEKFEIEQ